MILVKVFKRAAPDYWIYSPVCHKYRLYTQCSATDSDIIWHITNHMPGLLLLLSLTSVMELLHWSVTDKRKFMPVHTIEAYGGIKLQLCSFLTSPLDWGEWSASWPDWFTAKERAHTHTAGWALTENSVASFWNQTQINCTKFHCAGNLAPTICSPLVYIIS